VVVLDLYLGAISVRFSDRLKRPQEPMWSAALPIAVPALLVVATVLAFAPGSVGYAAETIAGALGCAVGFIGLAVIHAVTRGLNGRGAILAAVYAALVVLSGIPVILLAMIGIAESIFHLRARRLKPRGPTPT
jgi:Na+/proline symporter